MYNQLTCNTNKRVVPCRQCGGTIIPGFGVRNAAEYPGLELGGGSFVCQGCQAKLLQYEALRHEALGIVEAACRLLEGLDGGDVHLVSPAWGEEEVVWTMDRRAYMAGLIRKTTLDAGWGMVQTARRIYLEIVRHGKNPVSFENITKCGRNERRAQ